jgi:hypothetical protein
MGSADVFHNEQSVWTPHKKIMSSIATFILMLGVWVLLSGKFDPFHLSRLSFIRPVISFPDNKRAVRSVMPVDGVSPVADGRDR